MTLLRKATETAVQNPTDRVTTADQEVFARALSHDPKMARLRSSTQKNKNSSTRNTEKETFQLHRSSLEEIHSKLI